MVTQKKRISRGWEGLFSQFSGLGLLTMVVLLCSALLVLYCKDKKRCMSIEYQQLVHDYINLKSEKGRLLLEAGALSNQQQVQSTAEEKLAMHVPQPNTVVSLTHDASSGQ